MRYSEPYGVTKPSISNGNKVVMIYERARAPNKPLHAKSIYISQNSKGADQPSHMCRLICSIVVLYLGNCIASISVCNCYIFRPTYQKGFLINKNDTMMSLDNHLQTTSNILGKITYIG